MGARLEHAHCLETINNMWFLGKRETVNAWKKADFDGFRDKEEEVKYLPNGTNAGYMGSVGPLPLDGANSRKCLIIVDR